MTSHSSYFEWKPEDDTPEGLVADITSCVDMNIRIGSSCFAIMHHADSLVHNCEMAVYCARRGEEFEWNFTKNYPEHADKVEEIVTKVMENLREKGLCKVMEKSADG